MVHWVVLALSLGLWVSCYCLDVATEGTCSSGAGTKCPAALEKVAERRHLWPNKGGNLNMSGASQATARFDLAVPSWTFSTGGVVHTSPVIDDNSNVYITITSGRVVSLNSAGAWRWEYTSAPNPGVPALHGDAMYFHTQDGVAHSLSLETGRVRWRSKIGLSCPGDSAAAIAAGDVIIMATNLYINEQSGNCDVVAVEAQSGDVRWKYSLCNNGFPRSFNMLPAVVGSWVIFHDCAGGVHSVSLKDGSARWHSPAPSPVTMTTGSITVGPNGLVYCGFQYEGHCDQGKGMVRAHDVQTGQVRWSHKYEDNGINAGPAIGRLKSDGPLVLIVVVCTNFMPPLKWWEGLALQQTWLPPNWKRWMLSSYRFPGRVEAFNAETGTLLWTFHLEEKQGWSYAGVEHGCLPDCAGNPSIGADGTVYVNWSAGMSYAIRDANSDGRIDGNDPREVSKLIHGGGTNGQTAVTPNLLVAPSCFSIFGWRS